MTKSLLFHVKSYKFQKYIFKTFMNNLELLYLQNILLYLFIYPFNRFFNVKLVIL